MKTPAALVILGVLLIIFHMNMPIRVFRVLGDLPYYLGLACLVGGTLLGLIRGPNAVRLTVVLWCSSFAVYMLGLMFSVIRTTGYGGFNIPPTAAAFFLAATVILVLTVIQGIRAYRAQTARTQPQT